MKLASSKVLNQIIAALLTLTISAQAAASNCDQALSRPTAKSKVAKRNIVKKLNDDGPAKEAEAPPKSQEQVLLELMRDLSQNIENKLDGQPDPFIVGGFFDSERAFRLMDGLSFEKIPGSEEKRLSVLGDVRKFMHAQSMQTTEYTPELKAVVKRIFSFSEDQIRNDSPAKADLYRAYLAIELILPFIYKIQKVESVDRDGEKQDDKDKKDKKDKDKKQDDQQDEEESEEDPQLQELPEDYDPSTKDTDKEGEKGKKPKPFLHMLLSAKTAYFKQRNFNIVTREGKNRFLSAGIPALQPNDQLSSAGAKKLKINIPQEEIGKPFSLFVPSGFAPVNFKGVNYSIQQEANGSYKITLNALSAEIEVTKDVFELNPIQEEFFKTPIGISDKEWPEKIQHELLPLLKGQNVLRQAELIEAFVRNQYLYSVDAKEQKDPIEALNAGAFQCDMAALIMVGLLRDHLKIPSRAVGGFRAKSGGKDASALFLPSEGHAWVEVLHNGQVYTFDPTPKNKDRKTKGEGGGAAADEQKEFDDETFPSEDQNQDDFDGESKDGDDDKDAKDAKEGKEGKDGKPQQQAGKGKGQKQDPKDGKDGAKGEKDGEGQNGKEDKDGKDGKGGGKQHTAEEIHRAQEELENELEVGSLSLKDNKTFNKLIDRAIRVMLRDVNAPQFDSSRAHKLLPLLKAQQGLKSEKYMKLFEEAAQAVQYKQGPIVEALLMLSGELKKTSLNTSYKKLLQILDRLELFLKLSDPNQRSKSLQEAVRTLKKAQDEYLKLTKANAHEIAVVRKFMTELPPHSRRIFADKFKIKSVEQSPGVSDAYKALVGAKESNLNLIRVLYPLTNFILDSVPTPSFKRMTTEEEDSRSEALPEYVSLKTLQRSKYAIRGNPQKSTFENLRAGTLYLKSIFRETDVPNPGGITDPYRVTIGLYDTSGSMSGSPGDFQAALLAAFTDRALSEVGPSGQHRHIVQLMGFDDDVHTTTAVKNSQDAYDVIKDYRSSMANTSGGTDIQKALQQAFAAIQEAQKKAGEPLASANIVLMTDGQSPVDLEKVRLWRAAIDRRTQVKILFVAINGTNPDLMKLVSDVKSVGVNESYYYEFTGEDIEKNIQKSNEVPKVDMKRDYHSEAKNVELSPQVAKYLEDASGLVRRGIAEYENYVKTFGHDRWEKYFASLQYFEGEGKPTFLTEVRRFREFLEASPMLFEEQRLNTIVLDEILRNLPTMTGRKYESLDVKEVEMVKWVPRQLRQKIR